MLNRPALAAALACCLSACGAGLEDAGESGLDAELLPDDEATVEQELAVPSPADRLIVWQQNIEAMKAAKVAPGALTTAMLRWTYKPDIVVMQEAWQRVLCGDYLNEAQDPSLANWKQSLKDAGGLARTCAGGRGPLPGSVLHRLGASLWGGAANAEHRRPFSDTLGSQSRTGVTVVWDKRRFVFQDSFVYDDSMVPGCPDGLASYKRVAVLLRDTRRTASTADDRLVAVASAHYGSACRASNDRYVAEQMVARWRTFGGLELSLRFLGGDFNTRVDEASPTYAERRREEAPGSWYRAITANTTWRGGKFLDPVRVRHASGTGDGAPLCGQWTYPNVASCAAKTACSATCAGWGIGGKLDRLDYLFVSNATGTLSRARIISAETDDTGAGYADHKALRVSVLHD